MTSRVIHNGEGHPFPGGVKEIVISCDHMSCTTALSDTAIRAGGGLKAMGWETVFQNHQTRHYCPDHNRS